MTALDVALDHAAAGRKVFPCQWQGEGRKRPLIEGGLNNASDDPAIISPWWWRWPMALIGMPAGQKFVVLDIDVKHDSANGYDTLDELGFAILPDTPMAHTPSGGLHLYFAAPPSELRNTGGARGRGIGPGLDWRGLGGYVIAPSPGSGYAWDSHWNLATAPLAAVPMALLPREQEQPTSTEPLKPTTGLSRYAERALDDACRKIIAAPAGEQEITVNGEAFGIGTLAGARGIPVEFARRTLTWAARQIASYDSSRPWRAREIEAKVNHAFDEGLRQPREARHA